MIVCPNCSHENPDGASQCEACYTPLPATSTCPNCGATVQADASFCGQCGFNLKTAPASEGINSPDLAEVSVPDLEIPDPLVSPDPIVGNSDSEAESFIPPPPDLDLAESSEALSSSGSNSPNAEATSSEAPASTNSATQLQKQSTQLLHVQTNVTLELPANLALVHIGKPNDRIPPDIDVSGFPHSEVVSRIHADIRVEGDTHYIEDVGSSNGTYINNVPLPPGNRHRLRPGDRISLGKGDLVTFLFQVS